MKTQLEKYLRDIRLEAGLTQFDVAEKAGYETNQLVSNIERGLAPAAPSYIKALCQLTKTKPEIIIEMMTEIYAQKLRNAVGVK